MIPTMEHKCLWTSCSGEKFTLTRAVQKALKGTRALFYFECGDGVSREWVAGCGAAFYITAVLKHH